MTMTRFRRIQLLLVAGGILAVVGVSLSDRAPALVADGVMMGLRILGLRSGQLTAATLDMLPFATDTISHAVVWGVVGLGAAGTVRTIAGRLNLAWALFTLSALVEVGQQYLSFSRSAELSDLAANGVGLAVGMVAYTTVELLIRLARPARLELST